MSFIIFTILLLSAFQQSLSGFGFSLVAMPILVQLIGIQVAAPLVAALALTLNIINGIRWREYLDLSEIKRLGLWMLLGVPIGILSVDYLPENALKMGLGGLLVAYALFSLLKPEKLPIISRRWAYPAGFFAGLLGGAYNTSGPPLILYGNLRNWTHDRFRAVLQTLFGFAAAMVVFGHILTGHYTADVRHWLWITTLAVLLGVLIGALLERYLKPQHLRTWITILTLLLGISLSF